MELPIKVTLKRPVSHDGSTYKSLSFDEPDLGAQIRFLELQDSFRVPIASGEPPHPIDAARASLFWIAELADVSEAVVAKLKESDMVAVNAAMSAIMDDPESEGEPGNAQAA